MDYEIIIPKNNETGNLGSSEVRKTVLVKLHWVSIAEPTLKLKVFVHVLF